VGWWRLDETSGTTVHDYSGFGNNGTASGAIGPSGNPQSVTAFVGKGLRFYSGSHITVNGPSPSLNFGTNGKFTIDAWFKGHNAPIVGNYNTATKTGYHLYALNNGLKFDIGDGATLQTLTGGPPINPNVWTFVAVTVDLPNKQISFYVETGPWAPPPPPANIPAGAANAASVPLTIGGCPGNTNGCGAILDEVEIFNRVLPPADLKAIFDAGSAGKCRKGMTWIHSLSNNQFGTITVGCGSSGPNPCDPIHGDTQCTQQLPLLCIFRPSPPFTPPPTLNNTDPNNRWAGGLVATTPPVAAATFLASTDATAMCVAQFGLGWRVAEFHDGAGWNFQAYGGTVSAPTVPSTRFWVHINDQPLGNCWTP
jgi:hypothetical protein